MDTSQYLDVFIDESMEHLETINEEVLELEKNPENEDIIEKIFRAAHTLKGMSATMGYQNLADLTHDLEEVFDAIRNDELTVTANLIDVVFDASDYLNAMIDDIASGGSGEQDVSMIMGSLKQIVQNNGIEQTPEEVKPSQQTIETGQLQTIQSLDEFERTILQESVEQGYTNYEITIELSENCLLKGARVFMVFEVLEQLGEIIKSEPSVTDLEEENFDLTFALILVSYKEADEIKDKISKVSEIKTINIHPFSFETYGQQRQVEKKKEAEKETVAPKTPQTTATAPARKTIRVNIERLDILMNLFEELVIDRGRLEQISQDLDHSDLRETVERMTRVSGDLQNIILNMRMVPIDQVFNRFPRMIRQLSRELEKDVNIEIIGAETELDRTVIDEIGDPLVHLIRNAMDHGIEMPEERMSEGKPAQGTIQLKAFHSGNHVFIEISDDGAGIDKDKVLASAIAKDVIAEDDARLLSDQQIYELIMESGFSTSDEVSDVSGRGVGLDVVKTTIEMLGGSISIDSTPGKGSVFSIQLPLTLSIISVLLVELSEEKYAIPLSSILETAIVHKDDILNAHHKKVIHFRGKVVPLAFLNEIFAVPTGDAKDNDYYSIVIVKQGDKMTGLVVDSFIGQQEVVLKSLGNYLTNIFAISGATILGDGEVALIIDSNALIK
ncbi:MAG TPA: chemotaxis protein CheA [Bacillota bacterium]|nr:chemotaxis protein CheA [Bacillota bacterium]